MYTHTLAEILKKGGIAVLATDTLYGIVANALQKDSVEKIYALKNRDLDKPYIILISNKDQLKNFDVDLSPDKEAYLNSVWPGKVSVILPLNKAGQVMYPYLHRGKNSLSFRVPAKRELRELLQEVGPLVAPSANTQSNEPAKNITEAKSYFGDAVNVYVDEGEIIGVASRLIDITGAEPIILRN